jgi:hypothetical protein
MRLLLIPNRLLLILIAVTSFTAMAFSCVAVAQDGQAQEAQEAQEAQTQEAQTQEDPSVATELTEPPLDESGNLVQFERDIAPILQSRCLECHGPEDAKEDFRVDDPDIFLELVEAGDVEASTLYTDYLTTADGDLRMPPKEQKDPLSAGEIALIRVWIEEGANWPEGFQLSGAEIATEAPPAQSLAFSDRIWKVIGYLHPAMTHFPIALFLLGAVFVVVGWKWPAVGTQIPLACLFIGTGTAIATSYMGWSLAPTKGYGAGWEFLSFEREIDAHRWTAVIVTGIACISVIVALIAYRKDSIRLHMAWKIGLLICGATVGLVGHQGGVMTHGPDFYPEMLRTLFGERANDEPVAEEAVPAVVASDDSSKDLGNVPLLPN